MGTKKHSPWGSVRVLLLSDQTYRIKLILKPWFNNALWSLPGGHKNEGETTIEAAVREISEETGIVIDPERCSVLDEGTPGHANPFREALVLAWATEYEFDHPQDTPQENGRELEVRDMPVGAAARVKRDILSAHYRHIDRLYSMRANDIERRKIQHRQAA